MKSRLKCSLFLKLLEVNLSENDSWKAEPKPEEFPLSCKKISSSSFLLVFVCWRKIEFYRQNSTIPMHIFKENEQNSIKNDHLILLGQDPFRFFSIKLFNLHYTNKQTAYNTTIKNIYKKITTYVLNLTNYFKSHKVVKIITNTK